MVTRTEGHLSENQLRTVKTIELGLILYEKAGAAKKGKSALKSGERRVGSQRKQTAPGTKRKRKSIKEIFKTHGRVNLFLKLPTEGGKRGGGAEHTGGTEREGREGEKTGYKLNQTRHSKSLFNFLFH